MKHQEALTSYLVAFIEGLVHAGIKDVVISPGSRSTPLATLMAEHHELKIYPNIDERSAAFFALGLAKASRAPAALLCTSGTAAANYYPAIIEASLSRVPLIVLTADRPPELRDIGAPQAIDQIHLYGHHVRWFAEMALPEAGEGMISYANTAAVRAAAEARGLPEGPVHLNFPFREPLSPLLDPPPFSKKDNQKSRSLTIEDGRLDLSSETLSSLINEWRGYEKGLIVCGPIDNKGFPEAVKTLAKKLGFPVLADPLSQLRSSSFVDNHVIDSYDAILRSEKAFKELQPQIVIRFGGMPVSKSLTLYLKNARDAEHVVVDGGAGWRDSNNIATKMIYSDEALFCNHLSKLITGEKDTAWLTMWQEMDLIAKDAISAYLHTEEELDEGKSILELAKLLPENSTMFVGNSMPIRDVDTFLHKNNKNIRIMANRGANGIDGVVSTALGAGVYERPLYLVIGDLSFFHDMNGLLAAKMHKLNLTIIMLNNDGGGIFSYLPQAKEPKHFEKLFGTPTGLNYEHAVRMYDGQYTKINDWEDFRIAVKDSINNEGLNVIEIPTDRAKNTSSHREMWGHVSREINNFLQDV